MPVHPLRRCTYQGCRIRVTRGRCELHKKQANAELTARRGTRTMRGYSNRWGRYRLRYLKANPLCVHCTKAGRHTPARAVDHVIPINGEADPLFWLESNHQGLCISCHSIKTATQDPLTKQQRREGKFSVLEQAAMAKRYEGEDE